MLYRVSTSARLLLHPPIAGAATSYRRASRARATARRGGGRVPSHGRGGGRGGAPRGGGTRTVRGVMLLGSWDALYRQCLRDRLSIIRFSQPRATCLFLSFGCIPRLFLLPVYENGLSFLTQIHFAAISVAHISSLAFFFIL